MTQDQLAACIRMDAEGLHPVTLPMTHMTPIPGFILFADAGHTKLLMVQPDGRAVNLLEVHRLAEDCIRNWHEGMPKHIPGFVGDFGRLTKLAEALNGQRLEK